MTKTRLQTLLSLSKGLLAAIALTLLGMTGIAALAVYLRASDGAIRALKDQGLSIPEDVSVISFDHLCGEMPYLPRVTSIFASEGSVAVRGVQLLLNRIAHPDAPPQVEILPVKIFDEGTTAPPPITNR